MHHTSPMVSPCIHMLHQPPLWYPHAYTCYTNLPYGIPMHTHVTPTSPMVSPCIHMHYTNLPCGIPMHTHALHQPALWYLHAYTCYTNLPCGIPMHTHVTPTSPMVSPCIHTQQLFSCWSSGDIQQSSDYRGQLSIHKQHKPGNRQNEIQWKLWGHVNRI